MLRARYDPINLFDLVHAFSIVMDPVLTQPIRCQTTIPCSRRSRPT